MRVHNHKKFFDRRKELRRNATLQENVLWDKLRNNQLGLRFRRQHSVGGYILDFYCFKRRLIIEVDGPSHEGNIEYDRVRDKYFSDLGYKILRFKNLDVDSNLEKVLSSISLSLRLGEGGGAG